MVRSSKEAFKFLGRVPLLNWGGCLVAAYVYYLNEKRNGTEKDIQLVELEEYEKTNIRHNQSFLKGKYKTANSDNHFAWIRDGNDAILYDGTGIMPFDFDYKLQIPKESIESFSVNSLNNGGWNPEFDRQIWLPKFEKFFKMDLSAIHHTQAEWKMDKYVWVA